MPPSDPADVLSERLRQATVAAFDLAAVALGARLGLYLALRDLGNANAGELASRAETDPRYTRDWLEQQAVSGIIAVWEQSALPDGRRYALTAGTEDLLTDLDGADRTINDVRCALAAILASDKVASSFMDGTGLPFSAYGEEMRVGQALANRGDLERNLTTAWLPALPDVHARLMSDEPARIAEIGFGAGWSLIALARAYPHARIDGLDLDAESVAWARANVEAAGLADRITVRVQDAADPELTGRYDLAFAFECIHDMTQPVAVLRAMRNLVGPGGAVLVGEDLIEDEFTAPGPDSERITYGFSLFHCLPVGMDGGTAVGTGAMMRDATFRSYCSAAGYRAVERLPLDHTGWRIYRLTA